MTAREIGFIVLKILGVLYCLYAVGSLADLSLSLLEPRWGLDGSLSRAAARAAGIQLIVDLGVAILLLQNADRFARVLFGGSERRFEVGVEPRQLLFLGLCLVGAWIAINELGLVLNRGIELLWYSGGERRGASGIEIVAATLSGLKSLVFVVIGWLVFRSSKIRLDGEAAQVVSQPPASPGASP